jgi:hypothetical protein
MRATIPSPTDGEVPGAPVTNGLNGANGTGGSHEVNGVNEGDELNDTEASFKPSVNGNRSKDTPRSYHVPLNTDYAYKPRKLRVVTIGAGFSGLLIAHKIQHRFPELQEFVQHTIYEARSDVGGTWLINHYPGVQCDVPAHIYAFPFDPNPNWSRFYSSGEEIQNYIKDTVKKWNLDRDVQLNTKVKAAQWEENNGRWKLTIDHNGEQRVEFCDILISAQGVLTCVFSSHLARSGSMANSASLDIPHGLIFRD